MEIGKLTRRSRRMFIKLLEAVKYLGTSYDSIAEFKNNDENIQMLFPIDSVGVSFTRLHQSLGVSSRTLSKYLKMCEKNGFVNSYRFGKEVRYFITEKGRKFLHEINNYFESEYMFSLHMLVGLAFFYPKARFIKHIVPIIKVDEERIIRLRYYSPLAIDKLPEGKIFTIVMKLLKGLGYEVFPRAKLEKLGVRVYWRLGEPVLRHNEIAVLLENKHVRKRPLWKLKHLLEWAGLLYDNIDALHPLLRPVEPFISIHEYGGNKTYIIRNRSNPSEIDYVII